MDVEERKLATIVFADLVGSTELGGSQDPERTRVLLERFYDAMAEEIERAGGTVEKFVGDAVLAVFGVPVAHEDDALRALRTAAEMRDRLERLNDDLERRFGSVSESASTRAKSSSAARERPAPSSPATR